MTNRSRTLLGTTVLVSLVSLAAALPAEEETSQRMPAYSSDGALRLPQDWRQWVFVGSSLGLSYTQGAQPGMEMFHETLMEPTAYKHFAGTGTFREGSMFVLVLHGTGEGVLPARRGRFAAELHGVEMAVKDSSRRPEGWAYYNFGGMGGIRDNAQALPKEACYNCHVQHATRDNVFLQFYPLLEDVAPRPVAAHQEAAVIQQPAASQSPSQSLALKGLDPVLLVAGREEMGKPEIVASHKGHRYQFVSEPNRAAFEGDAAKYAIQHESCPVVTGAPIDPALFVVHDSKIYAFATADCVQEFKARPSQYVKP